MIVTFKEMAEEGEKSGEDKTIPIFVKSTFPEGPETNKRGVQLSKLAIQARSLVRDLDPYNDLTFLRITCKDLEYMIAPDKDYFLIVIKKTKEEEEE